MKEKDSAALQEKEKRQKNRIWKFLVCVVGLFVKLKYRYDCEKVHLDGPYLLIANHASNSDPIFVGLANPDRPPAAVGSDHLERVGWKTKLLKFCFDLIPRSKAASGFQAVKQIVKVLKSGQPVVLFAEGNCSWDGVSSEIFPATGKLAKLARVPLVTYRLMGNYLNKPRWAKKGRRGPLCGRIVHIYSPEELAGMKEDEINAAINRDIFVDALDYAEKTGARYRGKGLAEGLEQALFVCPQCGKAGNLQTKGDEIFCTCGLRAKVDGVGHLTGGPFASVREWNVWQEKAYQEVPAGAGEEALFAAKGTFTKLPDGTPLDAEFCLDLKKKEIHVAAEVFAFADISDIAMVKTNRLLFTADGGYYEIFSDSAVLRPYLMAVLFDKNRREGK